MLNASIVVEVEARSGMFATSVPFELGKKALADQVWVAILALICGWLAKAATLGTWNVVCNIDERRASYNEVQNTWLSHVLIKLTLYDWLTGIYPARFHRRWTDAWKMPDMLYKSQPSFSGLPRYCWRQYSWGRGRSLTMLAIGLAASARVAFYLRYRHNQSRLINRAHTWLIGIEAYLDWLIKSLNRI